MRRRVTIHDQEHPVSLEQNRLATKKINAPETVFLMADKRQPGRAVTGIGSGGQPNRELRLYISTMASMSSCEGPFGPGFPFLLDEYSSRYFRFLSMS